jgi:hypothetical protein
MPALAYAQRAGALSAWQTVGHPGRLPIHDVNATASQITARDRAYDAQIREYDEMTKITLELKQQILAAVQPTYLGILSNADFGFADVSPFRLLNHLRDTYCIVEPEELEMSRASLKETWNVEEPMELLWERLSTAMEFATRHQDPISDFNAVNLTFAAIESTGVFTDACDRWRDRDNFTKTIDNLRVFFTKENKNRLRKLTAAQGGFHGANAAAGAIPTKPPPTPPATLKGTPAKVIVGDQVMYYCWSHGLGWNPEHTSASCKRKKEGHKDDATVKNLKGGCNTIMSAPHRTPQA